MVVWFHRAFTPTRRSHLYNNLYNNLYGAINPELWRTSSPEQQDKSPALPIRTFAGVAAGLGHLPLHNGSSKEGNKQTLRMQKSASV